MDRRLPWDAFSDWIHAIAVVTFDLELGQALEVRSSLFRIFAGIVVSDIESSSLNPPLNIPQLSN